MVPVLHRFVSELNLMIVTHVGIILDEEFLESYRKIFSESSFNRSINFLVDLRLTHSSTRTPTALQASSDFMKKLFKGFKTDQNSKVAVIATDDLSFGLARMVEAYTFEIPWDFLVSKSVKEACVWLKVPENILEDN